jgi:putative ABC transport system permease protein
MPDWKHEIRTRLEASRLPPEREAEIVEELAQHLEDRYQELLVGGAIPSAAEHLALAELAEGEEFVRGLQRIERRVSPEPLVLGAGHRVHLLTDLSRDLRYAFRTLFKRPGFAGVVILVLALGIGATSAIFSVVNRVLLRPLPYPEPDRLLVFDSVRGRINSITAPDFLAARARCQTCEQMAAHIGSQDANLTGGTEPDRVRLAQVSENLFATLGIAPILGRTFLPEEIGRPASGGDMQPSGISAIILSYDLWQRRFGGDPSVIGRTVQVEGFVCPVVGVMPAAFNFPNEAEAWAPVTLSPTRNNAYLRPIIRLKQGVTPTQAQTEMNRISGQLEEEFGQKNRKQVCELVPLQEQLVGNVRSSLLVFLGAVTFVLLIACANVANLLLARAASRQKEMALRVALGASRLRVVRQLLTESLLLAFAGGGLGLLLAFGILKLLLAFAPQSIPRLNAISIDPWVLGFTFLLSVTTGVVFGLVPSLQASRLDLNLSLKEGGTQSTGAPRHRLRSLLIVGEVSMALVLLIGAGLLLRSFSQLRETRLGFDPSHVLTASVTLPQTSYAKTAQIAAYYEQALARLSVRPEVQAVGVVNSLPLGDSAVGIQGDLTVEGEATERKGVTARKLAASADYFRALAIPLLKGRAFNEHDIAGSPGIVIISQSLSQTLWPNEGALGKRINIGLPGENWREVVGVVGDVRQFELAAPPSLALYQPYQQVPEKIRWFVSEMAFVIRTGAEPQSFIPTLRNELAVVDNNLPLHNVATMDQVVAKNVADAGFYALLLGSFSALALILAASGIYSVNSYLITQRTHEVGIRIALGAQTGAILRLIIRQGMILVMVGLVIGLTGAFFLSRVLSDFLYQVSTTDPLTFFLVALLLALVALIACYVPARKAIKVDPLVALRHE